MDFRYNINNTMRKRRIYGKLKNEKMMLEVVDNQLEDNDPPCTKRAYTQLTEAGCQAGEAKDKIAAIVLDEMYDVLKNDEPFDKKKFEASLKKMVQQHTGVEMEAEKKSTFEWDEVGSLISEGYSNIPKKKYSASIKVWLKAWEKIKEYVSQAEGKIGLHKLDEITHYEYRFDE